MRGEKANKQMKNKPFLNNNNKNLNDIIILNNGDAPLEFWGRKYYIQPTSPYSTKLSRKCESRIKVKGLFAIKFNLYDSME